MIMNCDQLRELYTAFRDGELDAQLRSEVEDHLAECPACAQLYTELDALRESIADAPSLAVPAGLSERVIAQVKQARPKPWIYRVGWQLGVAAMLVLVVGSYALMSQIGGMKSAEAPPPLASGNLALPAPSALHMAPGNMMRAPADAAAPGMPGQNLDQAPPPMAPGNMMRAPSGNMTPVPPGMGGGPYPPSPAPRQPYRPGPQPGGAPTGTMAGHDRMATQPAAPQREEARAPVRASEFKLRPLNEGEAPVASKNTFSVAGMPGRGGGLPENDMMAMKSGAVEGGPGPDRSQGLDGSAAGIGFSELLPDQGAAMGMAGGAVIPPAPASSNLLGYAVVLRQSGARLTAFADLQSLGLESGIVRLVLLEHTGAFQILWEGRAPFGPAALRPTASITLPVTQGGVSFTLGLQVGGAVIAQRMGLWNVPSAEGLVTVHSENAPASLVANLLSGPAPQPLFNLLLDATWVNARPSDVLAQLSEASR